MLTKRGMRWKRTLKGSGGGEGITGREGDSGGLYQIYTEDKNQEKGISNGGLQKMKGWKLGHFVKLNCYVKTFCWLMEGQLFVVFGIRYLQRFCFLSVDHLIQQFSTEFKMKHRTASFSALHLSTFCFKIFCNFLSLEIFFLCQFHLLLFSFPALSFHSF